MDDRFEVWLEQRADHLVSARFQVVAYVLREKLVEGGSHHTLDRPVSLGTQILAGSSI